MELKGSKSNLNMKVIYFLANPQSNGVLENVKREERM
jgi:hypothetical protein